MRKISRHCIKSRAEKEGYANSPTAPLVFDVLPFHTLPGANYSVEYPSWNSDSRFFV